MEVIDKATQKQNTLDSIKASNPKLDLSGVELIYEQHQKAYEDLLKHIEELNKQLNTTYN
jgi:hypothetical protein